MKHELDVPYWYLDDAVVGRTGFFFSFFKAIAFKLQIRSVPSFFFLFFLKMCHFSLPQALPHVWELVFGMSAIRLFYLHNLWVVGKFVTSDLLALFFLFNLKIPGGNKNQFKVMGWCIFSIKSLRKLLDAFWLGLKQFKHCQDEGMR